MFDYNQHIVGNESTGNGRSTESENKISSFACFFFAAVAASVRRRVWAVCRCRIRNGKWFLNVNTK